LDCYKALCAALGRKPIGECATSSAPDPPAGLGWVRAAPVWTTPGSMPPPVGVAVYRFLDIVETVFHSDWEYTRSNCMKITSYDDKARKQRQVLAFEDDEAESDREGPTFLAPELDPHDPEAQKRRALYRAWGNYQLFLEHYKALCAALDRQPIG